jgi:CRISPR type III-B/RAMP module-associated protein Cmr5
LANKYVKFASDIGIKLIKCVDRTANQNEGDKKAGLVRRAVDFPSLMLNAGFAPAFTFYISKVENYNNLISVFKYLDSDDQNSCEAIREELKKEEGAGYAGYVVILIEVLKKIGKIDKLERVLKEIGKNDKLEDKDKVLKEIIFELLDIANKVDLKDERLIMPYLYELKKVMEALPI